MQLMHSHQHLQHGLAITGSNTDKKKELGSGNSAVYPGFCYTTTSGTKHIRLQWIISPFGSSEIMPDESYLWVSLGHPSHRRSPWILISQAANEWLASESDAFLALHTGFRTVVVGWENTESGVQTLTELCEFQF